jgi:hypothetical protein
MLTFESVRNLKVLSHAPDSPRSIVIEAVSKRALQWYSKCYCVASVTKTFTFKGVQAIHRSTH